MSLSSRSIGEAPLADAAEPATRTKTPPKRTLTVLADPTLVPERR